MIVREPIIWLVGLFITAFALLLVSSTSPSVFHFTHISLYLSLCKSLPSSCLPFLSPDKSSLVFYLWETVMEVRDGICLTERVTRRLYNFQLLFSGMHLSGLTTFFLLTFTSKSELLQGCGTNLHASHRYPPCSPLRLQFPLFCSVTSQLLSVFQKTDKIPFLFVSSLLSNLLGSYPFFFFFFKVGIRWSYNQLYFFSYSVQFCEF